MPCAISGKLMRPTAAGGAVAVAGAPLWLIPSRSDFFWTPDGGTTWLPFEPATGLAAGAPSLTFAQVTSGVDGAWGFSAPVDTDIHLPVAAPTPALVWSIKDSVTGKVYSGPLVAGTVGTAKTLDELVQLSVPNGWKVGGQEVLALPQGTSQTYPVTFTSSSDEVGIVFSVLFPDILYRFVSGSYTDSSASKTVYSVAVKEGTKTTAGCTLKLSALPPGGATVQVDAEFRR